jgi:hypothetical protein
MGPGAEEPFSECGAEGAPERCADSDDRKQAFAGRFVEQIVAIRPELRDDRVAEDPDPDEERKADIRHVRPNA